MRRIPFALTALALLIGAGAAEAQTQALKIGFINSQQILATSTEAAAAEERFNQEMQGYQAEVEQLETELNGMQQRLQQQQLTLSPEARANREAQIQQKLQEYQTRTQQLQQQADQRRAELVQPVVDKITAIIETIREEGQYHLILDVAAGSIIAADSTLDLTPEVVRRLSATASGTGN
ncbi:MAG TPA: OmpH family outer membrane protein [Longimicrobiales bacterium]|nr:OmpH family outer membrane protein [Longimicrobiales bacterium]